jgi:crotonobetainyl-CoA:carnitine CoA-transferase CaiB-like acyl-CoA transferase
MDSSERLTGIQHGYRMQIVDQPDISTARPLSGVRILALEQMQALPFATQLLARLGADVVKVEPITGEMGRGSLPAIADPQGRLVGATFLRNNFGKRSVCVNLKDPAGRDLVLRMAPKFDVLAENAKPGTMARLGLSYQDVREVHPAVIYTSISGFGNLGGSPYLSWPAFAPVVEAMSGIYEMKRQVDQPPTVSPVGALGDISAALFAAVGILAALRRRDVSGEGCQVDVAMLDSVMAMTDIVLNFWSLGLRNGDLGPLINHGFRAGDGWFIIQVGREAHFARLAELVGHAEWVTDPRFANRQGWIDQLETEIRPAIEKWASGMTRSQACAHFASAGIAAGPCLRDEELATDPHVVARNMLSTIDRPDGSGPPVLVPGNPVKLTGVPDGPDGPIPWVGEHTDGVLGAELGLSAGRLEELRSTGVIA